MTDKEFLNKLAKKINKLIDKELKKYGYDRAYFEFLLKCDILDNSFKKIDEAVLIKDGGGYCIFCGKETHYYSYELIGFVCSCCLGKLKERKIEFNDSFIPKLDGTTGEFYER